MPETYDRVRELVALNELNVVLGMSLTGLKFVVDGHSGVLPGALLTDLRNLVQSQRRLEETIGALLDA